MSPSLRDRLLSTPDEIDPRTLPEGLGVARNAIRRAIARTAEAGVPDHTLALVLMSETLPRLIDAHGPLAVAKILECMSAAIAGGIAPNGPTQ